MPLSAIVGKREYMRHLPHTAWGMTFRGEAASLAAGLAVTRVLRSEQVSEHLAEIGSRVREGFRKACGETGVSADMLGPPARMTFQFGDAGALDAGRLRTLFVRECAREGILTTGTLLPTYAHNEEAVERTLHAFTPALERVRDAIESGRETLYAGVRAGFDAVRSNPNGATASLPAATIDRIREQPARLELEGWLLLESGPPDTIEAIAPGVTRTARRVDRPDVANVFPDVPGAAAAGFALTLPATIFAPEGDYDFTLQAGSRNQTEFRCRIVRSRNGGPSSPGAPRLEGGVLYV